ncbi:MAG: hypothetical protein ACEPOZ_14190 [Marinifilaceae bacterium]
MKRYTFHFVALIFLFLGTITSGEVNAQEKKKETRVKIFISEDGKNVKIDTVFHNLEKHYEIIELLKERNLSDSIMKELEDMQVWISKLDRGGHHGKHMHIMNRIQFSDSCKHHHKGHCMQKKMEYEIQEGEGDHRIIIKSMGDGDKILRHFDHDFFIKKMHGKKGKKIIIIEDEDDVEISEDGDVKVIRIRKKKGNEDIGLDDEIQVEVEVITDDETKLTKKKRKKKK